MSANVPVRGTFRALDRPTTKPVPVTERDVTTPGVLVRLLVGLLGDVGGLIGRWAPRRIDYEGRTLDATGTTMYRFNHGFGGPVRAWVVQWDGSAAACIRQHADTTDDVLVLTSTVAGVATIRVEEAG